MAGRLERALKGDLPEDWDSEVPVYKKGTSISTRVASGQVLNVLARKVPNLIGGSADLESSTMTHLKDLGRFSAGNYEGRDVYFGVREFAMGAIVNGMVLHGGVKPFGSTFFVFSDYLRPAVRLSALMNLPVTYVFTHDSIFVGEDGPTHEPIEQLVALRGIPNVTVLRPADANETAAAWKYAIQNQNGPVAIVLTRQNLSVKIDAETVSENIKKGAYIVAGTETEVPTVQLIATGSEVALALQVKVELEKERISSRVVSMPSWELFEHQSDSYQESILRKDIKLNVAIELGSPQGWAQYVGREGLIIGISTFGASAPGIELPKNMDLQPKALSKKLKQNYNSVNFMRLT